jgi:ribosomal protein S24E
MEFKIIEDKENPLFKRREIKGEIKAEITPSRKEIKDIVSKKFSVQPECIKIKTIKGKFGRKDFSVIAKIYPSKEDKDKIEIKKKKEIEEEKKALEEEKVQESPQKEQEEKSEGNNNLINESESSDKEKIKEDSSLINSDKSSEPASEQSKE